MTIETPDQIVERLNAELRGKGPHEIIRVALREFGRKLTYVSSFGAESAAMLGLIADVDQGMPIVFIDTGMHFHQTLQYRDTLGHVLGLTDIRTFHPVKDEVKAIDPKGVLNKTDPNACCEVRKVRPLAPALEGFDLRARVPAYLRATLAEVTPFYVLEKAGGFRDSDARGGAFATARLAAGASELRDLFILAWRDSADDSIGWPAVKVNEVEAGTADPWLAMYGED